MNAIQRISNCISLGNKLALLNLFSLVSLYGLIAPLDRFHQWFIDGFLTTLLLVFMWPLGYLVPTSLSFFELPAFIGERTAIMLCMILNAYIWGHCVAWLIGRIKMELNRSRVPTTPRPGDV